MLQDQDRSYGNNDHHSDSDPKWKPVTLAGRGGRHEIGATGIHVRILHLWSAASEALAGEDRGLARAPARTPRLG